MTVSLIITIYKSTDFLNRVLESVKLQTYKPLEIIITEDGEYEENRKLVESWSKKLSTPLVHLTQKDIGNRKPLALNKAILKSKGDYLVFVDGDCVLRKDFIADHVKMADEKSFITGRRVELSKKATDFLTPECIGAGYLNNFPVKLWADALFGETHNLGRFFKTPKLLRPLLSRNQIDDIRGCNFSVHRKHMISINGFSNDFSGAYGEDSDVEYRLKFLGLQMKSIKGAAIQYHLWHKTQVKDQENQERLAEVLRRKQPRAENGLEQASAIL
jgi:glycosyltransferase involved in cell wall biosynthesis